MKRKTFSIVALGTLLIGASAALAACGGEKGPAIDVWVGGESVSFYKKVAKEFFQEHPEYEYHASVKGVDTGTVAGTITTDPSAAADIYTVAHDNIAKLVDAEAAYPIEDQGLIDQVLADNPQAFKDVIYAQAKGEAEKKLYGVPYISQSLFLYYNKKFVSEEQAKSFEGLQAAAKAAGAKTKAFTVTGTDGFNFSFVHLARKNSDKSTSLKIYQNGERFENYFQGDDEIALVRWANEMFADDNGGMWPSANWITDVQQEKVLALIGGAWHYNSFASSCDDFGITMIPTLTLSSAHCDGLKDVKAGDVYRGGTFADCKVFMMNMNVSAEKRPVVQALMKYFSSKEVQKRSFVEVNNVPAFSGVSEYIESVKDELKPAQYQLGKAQTSMAEYGIAQPFVKSLYNTYYYSKGGPDKYVNLIKQPADKLTERLIRETLFRIEYTWGWGSDVEDSKIPEVLPASTKEQIK